MLIIALGLSAQLLGEEPHSDENAKAVTLSPADYWFHTCFLGITDEKESDGVVTGAVFEKRGWITFSIPRASLVGGPSQIDSCLKGVDSLISLVQYGESRKKVEDGLTHLSLLTGETFESAGQCRRWVKENRPFLNYSSKKRRLIVDIEAKQAGIRTLVYRQTHPWKDGLSPNEKR